MRTAHAVTLISLLIAALLAGHFFISYRDAGGVPTGFATAKQPDIKEYGEGAFFSTNRAGIMFIFFVMLALVSIVAVKRRMHNKKGQMF